MGISDLVSLVMQNGFLTVFASTVLFFMIRVGNTYLNKLEGAKVKIPDDIALTFIRSLVWYHSRGKLRHIEAILIENHIEERKEEVTRKVRNALEERTIVYVDYLNNLNTSIPKLGNYYLTVFDMETFFGELIKVVMTKYKANKEGEIAIKIKDISEIMFEYQEQTNLKIEKEFERIANK